MLVSLTLIKTTYQKQGLVLQMMVSLTLIKTTYKNHGAGSSDVG